MASLYGSIVQLLFEILRAGYLVVCVAWFGLHFNHGIRLSISSPAPSIGITMLIILKILMLLLPSISLI
jgi:hypothetical protein